jgi:pyruvate dehydrogenase E2 component (dihydrolipoamide acetyltransferase)
MAAVDIAVPDIGDFKDVPVIDVLVKPGDTVRREDPLVTLESEKATMDIPSTADGVVAAIRVKIGDRVSQGMPIVSVETAAPQPAVAAAVASSAPAPAQDAPAAAAPPSSVEVSVPDIGDFKDIPVIEVLVKAGDIVAKEDPLVTLESEKASMDVPSNVSGVVERVLVKIGDKLSAGAPIVRIATADGAVPPPLPAPARAAAAAPVEPPAALPMNGKAHHSDDGAGIHASPAIRRFARELGVPLADIRGSGPNGRITRDDVQNFVKRALHESSVGSPAAGIAGLAIAPAPRVDFAQYGPIERKPLTRIQKIAGPNLHRNWVTIPHVTSHDDADITSLEAFRVRVNGEQSDVKVTMLAFLIKACVATLKAFPNFNSSLDGGELVLKRYYHIGFAADTPDGLVVPVVRDADTKGILAIAAETAALAGKARSGKLGLAEMQGGTFTISSLGGIGGTYFTPIVNAPEVAILGVCRAAMKPVWDGAAFEPKLMLPLSLSWDHRVVDGAAAARFLTHLASVLGDMRRTML